MNNYVNTQPNMTQSPVRLHRLPQSWLHIKGKMFHLQSGQRTHCSIINPFFWGRSPASLWPLSHRPCVFWALSLSLFSKALSVVISIRWSTEVDSSSQPRIFNFHNWTETLCGCIWYFIASVRLNFPRNFPLVVWVERILNLLVIIFLLLHIFRLRWEKFALFWGNITTIAVLLYCQSLYPAVKSHM